MTHFAEVQCFACQASSFLAASNEAMLQNCACYFLRVGDLYSLAERVNVKSIAGVLCLSPLHQHEHTPQVDDEDLDMARWECRRLEKRLAQAGCPAQGGWQKAGCLATRASPVTSAQFAHNAKGAFPSWPV